MLRHCLVLGVVVATVLPCPAQSVLPVLPSPGPARLVEHWCATGSVGAGGYGDRGLGAGTAWPGGQVYYEFDPAITPGERQKMLDAFAVISAVANIQFIPRTIEPNHIYIEYMVQYPGVSQSTSIGMSGTRQYLRIWPAHFDIKGGLVHEILHALGYLHEQSRIDRGSFIQVITANIDPQFISQFNTYSGTLYDLYDYASVMHYDPFAFAVRGTSLRVVVPFHRLWQWRIGFETVNAADPPLSVGDRRALVARYGGPTPPPAHFAPVSPSHGAVVGTNWTPSFSWNSSSGATGWRLEVDDDPYFRSPEINVTLPLTPRTYTHSGPLTPRRVYFWRVFAQNAAGETLCYPLERRTFYTGDTAPSRLYVAASAPPGGDGLSWNSAMNDLAIATELAAANGGVTEIRVSQGVYRPDCASGDRTASFWVGASCALKGGYAGTGAPDPDARDFRAYPTILSGDLADNDGPNFANNEENSYHVVMGDRTTAAALVEGFTIRGGNADGPYLSKQVGAGIFVHLGILTIRDCTFEDHYAKDVGGAAILMEGDLVIDRCTFARNTAENGGGAIFIYTCGPRISNSLFHDNAHTGGWRTWSGGAVLSFIGTPRFVNCTFADNSSVGAGGAILAVAGSSLGVDNSIIHGNSAVSAPGIAVNADCPACPPCTVTIRGTIHEGGVAGISLGGISDVVNPTDVFDANPVFADAAGGDYRIQRPSPGVDRGNNTLVPTGAFLDLDSRARFIDDPLSPDLGTPGGAGGSAIVDLGAFEFVPPPPPACDPDVNCDGSADGFDVEAMEQMVGGDPTNFCQADADFNGDGSVDGFDVEAVESVVGGGPCP